jgi:hypothetical protein
VYAPYGTLGNSGRNSLNNPNVFNWDFSIVKDTKLNEKISMQFRAEFFDVLNHPNFFYGSQTYLMGTPGTVTPSDPRYQYLSDPAAYRNPGGAICNGGQGPLLHHFHRISRDYAGEPTTDSVRSEVYLLGFSATYLNHPPGGNLGGSAGFPASCK